MGEKLGKNKAICEQRGCTLGTHASGMVGKAKQYYTEQTTAKICAIIANSGPPDCKIVSTQPTPLICYFVVTYDLICQNAKHGTEPGKVIGTSNI